MARVHRALSLTLLDQPAGTKIMVDACRARHRLLALLIIVPLAAVGGGLVPNDLVAADALTYERDIRPLLKTHCFRCHGEAGIREGTLDLRLRRLILLGGDSGAAVVPGDPESSLVLQRLRAGEMPPPEVMLRPTAEEIAKIDAWIVAGAPTLRDEPADLDPDHYFTEEERQWWAYQPVRCPPVPDVRTVESVRTAVDRFVLSRLEAEGLALAPEANRATLIRRLSLDLLGLPPTPDEVAAFLADTSPDAYERLVDRLLASPHYGERWGRHWLDVAGYADSEGYTDDDTVRPDAYKYRDYVIRSLNANKPLDRFVVEQLAGDELIGGKRAELTPQEVECLIATGFLRTAPDGTGAGQVDQGVARNEVIAKTLQIVSSTLLGTTVACAQCHDHRYDPIPQADYYALRAVFEPAYDWKNWLPPAQRRVSLYTEVDRQQAQHIEELAKEIDAARTTKQDEFIARTLERELAKLPETLREPLRMARATPDAQRTPEQQQLLKEHPSVNVTAGSLYLYDSEAAAELKKMADRAAEVRGTKPPEEFVRALWEPTDHEPPKTFLFQRGDHERPQQEIAPRELSILTQGTAVSLPVDDTAIPTTGRRLTYARWLTNGQHPLVARVLANRLWMHHFGRGIVATPADFGHLGAQPTHPELLDWLAHELVSSGWNLKRMQRLLVTSSVYRQAAVRSNEAQGIDAENRLYHRRAVRRLEAEVLRDTILTASGRLNAKQFGPPVPVMADEVGQFVIGTENLDAGRPGAVIDMKGEQFRRSVYVQARRSRPLSVMDPFDLPVMEPNCAARNSTTVTPQSLLLMNSEFVLDEASAMAERVAREAGADPAAQVTRAWALAYGVPPTADELAAAQAFTIGQETHFASFVASQAAGAESDKNLSPANPRHDALTSLCHLLFSSNRFLYAD